MIAYVDENGVITDTPPTTNEKPQEIDISTIEVSTPRKTDEPVITEYEGRVVILQYVTKGYGFIKKPEKCREVLFPCKRLQDEVTDGNLVTFKLERGPRGMNAVEIKHKK